MLLRRPGDNLSRRSEMEHHRATHRLADGQSWLVRTCLHAAARTGAMLTNTLSCNFAHALRRAVNAARSHAMHLRARAKVMQEWADFLEQNTARCEEAALSRRCELIAHERSGYDLPLLRRVGLAGAVNGFL